MKGWLTSEIHLTEVHGLRKDQWLKYGHACGSCHISLPTSHFGSAAKPKICASDENNVPRFTRFKTITAVNLGDNSSAV